MIIGYFFTFLAYILILAFLVLNILAQEKYKKSKTIYINNPAPVCTYGTDTPTINTDTLEPCYDLTKGVEVSKTNFIYSVGNDGKNKFVVSKEKQVFYTTVCKGYCSSPNNLINGNCNNPNENYTSCINLLEPPQGCKNSAQAIFVDQNGSPYFAQSTFPQTNCVSAN